MTSVEDALDYWRTQLSLSARRSLVLDWQDRARTVEFSAVPLLSLDLLADGQMVGWDALAAEAKVDDVSRVDPLVERAEEAFRDRGNPGLNLVLGTAVIPGVDGEMPLVILPLSARRKARRLPQIDIEASNELTVCPSTLDLLRRDFAVSVNIPVTGLRAAVNAVIEMSGRTDLPAGIALSTRCGLVVQSSNWLDVQHDLESFVEARESILIRAIAGDLEARQEVRRPDLHEPDGPGPLVLPADASQRDVLRRVRRGSTMIVEGPPGTGKSQTIANLLAGAVAAGRTVLFVAQKRAAVDVVVSRLREVGLGDLVLDVHDDTARFQPVQVQADPTGQVRILPPIVDFPAMDRATRHAGAVQAAWPMLGDLMRRGGDTIPDLEDRVLDSIRDRVDGFREALRAFAGARRSLESLGFTTPSPVLRSLLARSVELQMAAEALLLLPPSTPSVSAAVGCASSARTIAQVVSQVRPEVLVPSQVALTDQLVTSLYKGPYRDMPSRRAVLTAFLTAADSLRRAGLVDGSTTVAQLEVITTSPGWVSLATLPDEVLRQLCRSDESGRPLSAEPPSVAAAVISCLASSGHQMPSGSIELLAELELQGSLDVFVDDDDPAGLFSASIAEALVRRLPLARTIDLEADARNAEVQVARSLDSQRQRIVAIAAQRRADHVADSSVLESTVEYEGLVRHARTRKVRNAEVLSKATATALAFFPIVVASPTGAARSLPRKAELFDLVVFDEASQLETAVAVSSLARARQAVVFGDSLQLPPDRFFQGAGTSVTDAVLSQNSLLDSVATLLTGTDRTAYLKWHYRSVDGALVRFVNEAPALYGSRMTLFPAPPNDHHPITLRLTSEHDLVSDVAEVLTSIDPAHSVAVVTLGIELSDRLDAVLHLPDSPDDLEPSVVRNIERFQGDERDHVILVLPVASPGTSALQALGPINQAGGERRLNVALTRARQRLTVVSTFDFSALAGAQTPGAMLLRDFLRHLTTGRRQEFVTGQHLSVHTDPIGVIEDRLRSAGLEVWRPVSELGHVPLAVRCDSGRFLVVDVDTPASCTLDALDRELLLPAELRRRGWGRVRSTVRDWIERPADMVSYVVDASRSS